MRIVSISCLHDNYAYLLICEQTNLAVVIDPSEASPVMAAIKREGVAIRAIWNTHHHYDHVGGNSELLSAFPTIDVVAHQSDRGRVPGQTHFVDDDDVLDVGEEIQASVIFNPGHTSGAVSYYLSKPGAVFTGDTLFAAGCGRLFEGTAAEMYTSLMRLSDLPDTTLVYCGHEYTAANLHFAIVVDAENTEVQRRLERVLVQRELGESTMGFQISEELATNAFIRCAEPAVISSVAKVETIGEGTPVEVFAALRRWKDRF